MSPTVVQAVSSIICRPFLALAITLDESHNGQRFGYNVVLFPVSPRKPDGEFAGYYASTRQANFLRLGLPSESLPDIIYIHTAPALYLKAGLPSRVLPYQLHVKCLQQLLALGNDHQTSLLQAAFQRLKSGGEESVQEGWDTWSGNDLYDVQVPFGDFKVEYLNPDGFDLGTIGSPNVLEELMVFKKWDTSGRLPVSRLLTVNADYLWITATSESMIS